MYGLEDLQIFMLSDGVEMDGDGSGWLHAHMLRYQDSNLYVFMILGEDETVFSCIWFSVNLLAAGFLLLFRSICVGAVFRWQSTTIHILSEAMVL